MNTSSSFCLTTKYFKIKIINNEVRLYIGGYKEKASEKLPFRIKYKARCVPLNKISILLEETNPEIAQKELKMEFFF